MPWEIFRADRILLPEDKRRARTVTFFTKDGGVPRYRSIILIVPEYDLGITVLTAGDETLLEVIVDMVIVPLIRAADALAARQVKETYMGRYTSSSTKEKTVNSTLTLTYTSTHGLEINEWISNSTDVLGFISKHFQSPENTKFHAQLIPSGLYRDDKELGEVWRIAIEMDRENAGESVLGRWTEQESIAGSWSGFLPVSEEFCISDVDNILYGGIPLSEAVFWDRHEKTGMLGRWNYRPIGSI